MQRLPGSIPSRIIKSYCARLFSISTMEELKIGLYNYLPMQMDSYRNYINEKWKSDPMSANVTLNMENKYDPYDDLQPYLDVDGLDLMEVDMGTKDKIKGLVVEIDGGTEDGVEQIGINRYIGASLDAVRNGSKFLGYPTFACANWLMELKHNQEECDLLDASDYDNFIKSAKMAKHGMVYTMEQRLFGGRLGDSTGWHLPNIYLEGVIDYKGKEYLYEAIQDVKNDKPNMEVVKRIKTFADFFKDGEGKFEEKAEIIPNVIHDEDCYYFGYSEKLSTILEKDGGKSIAAVGVLSPVFGKQNYTLLYTDALVINKKRYESASLDKKKAIWKFVSFFVSDSLRKGIVMGEDVTPPQTRYLLPPTRKFYMETSNILYQEYGELLKKAVSSPALSKKDKQTMVDVLKPLILPGLHNN